MVNLGIMAIGLVFAGLAGLNIAQKRYYKKKFKDLQGEYGKRCAELTNALGEVGRVKLKLDAIINSEGWNLAMRDCKCDVQGKVVGEVMVVMRHKVHTFDFRIKTFMYDINDPSDREFAIREADELIETIQKF